jgi:poly-gamma-glutamate synthesis protein (capsule biosynthesis protein)
LAKIAIVGDFSPVGGASAAFAGGDGDWFFGSIGSEWSNADYRILNLECPLVEANTPINKAGPCLSCYSETAGALSDVSLVGLANNHILDHGEVGLNNTISLLDQAGVPHLGAGANLSEAGQPHIAEIGDVSVGFLAWSHHEFCIATESSAGAFPIDLTLGLKLVEELRESCDFVILFYHGGVEHFPYPTPEQRKSCRFLAERGVDLIVCQHSHIIGASEVVGDSTILYGQGNYCFDLKGKESLTHWYQGLMLDVDLEVGKPLQVEFVPIVQDTNNGMRPTRASPRIATEILKKQSADSQRLAVPRSYEEVWNTYVKERANEFLYWQLPVGRYIRKALKILGFMRFPWGQRQALKMLNRMECEAHSVVIVAGLKRILREK